MPEGDTIYRAAQTLRRALVGDEVTGFSSVLPHLDRVDEDSPLVGRTIDAVTSRGKHLLMAFSGALELRTHMRMSGSWHIYRHGEPWQKARRDARIRLETRRFVVVAFNVHDATFIRTDAGLRVRRSFDPTQRLGPDLLAPSFGPGDYAECVRRLRRCPHAEVGVALLDQTNVAGIGNQYRSEVAFVTGVHPRRAVGSLDDAVLRHMLQEARRLLQANVQREDTGAAASMARTMTARTTTGQSHPDERLWVYGRAGRACRRCGTNIEVGRAGAQARVLFWCPTCQPA